MTLFGLIVGEKSATHSGVSRDKRRHDYDDHGWTRTNILPITNRVLCAWGGFQFSCGPHTKAGKDGHPC